MRLSVLLVAPMANNATGGQAKFATMLAAALEKERDIALTILPIPLASETGLFNRLASTIQLAGGIIRHRDSGANRVVHIFSPCNRTALWEKLLLGLLAKGTGSRVVFNFRNSLEVWYHRWTKLEQRLVLWFLGMFDVVLCQYQGLVDFLRHEGLNDDARLAVIGNGISLSDQFARQVTSLRCNERMTTTERDLNILFVGEIGNRKGVDTIIEAMHLLEQRGNHQNVVAWLYGRGARRNSCDLANALATQYRVEHLVKVAGELIGDAEKARVFVDADIFVLPSRAEGFPNAILEAMLSGLPVIGSEVGAMPDVIRPSRNGFLISPGDAEGLAECLEQLILDAGLRERIGLVNREDAISLHDFENTVGQFVGLYHESVGSAST